MLPPIEKSRVLPFPVSDVYAAWVSSETIIPPATAMEIEPRVGGHYRLIINTPDFKSRCEGTFLIVELEQRVVYSWQWQGDEEVTKIDVRFHEAGEGTKITIVHLGFTSEQSRTNHDQGWDSYLDGLEAHLARVLRESDGIT